MGSQTKGSRPAPAVRRIAGERVGGLIYGTIVTLSVVVAGGRAYPDDTRGIAELVLVTSSVFWLAHVYAHALGESVAHGTRLSLAVVRRIARHEFSIIEAAVPPLTALTLGALGLLSASTAIWLSFLLGLAVLCIAGVIYARIEQLGAAGMLLAVATNLALGLILVELKLTLGH